MWTDKQINAVEKSVLKWYNVVYNDATEYGESDCQCCIDFQSHSCRNCPVAIFTGQGCGGIPYSSWVNTAEEVLGEESTDYFVNEESMIFAKAIYHTLQMILIFMEFENGAAHQTEDERGSL
jgi:hypothetical protein